MGSWGLSGRYATQLDADGDGQIRVVKRLAIVERSSMRTGAFGEASRGGLALGLGVWRWFWVWGRYPGLSCMLAEEVQFLVSGILAGSW